jgi:cysteine desulfurase family protein (TIGR01976 family)
MTELTFQVARTLARNWAPGDEVVVTRLDHDGNVRPWVTYAERSGATLRWAEFDPETGTMTVDDVLSQVTDATRVVAVTGASNLLGTRPDIAAIGAALASSDAMFYVDGVHLTAHAAIDMQAIGADFYVCSPYKFLGPHLGMLAASPALLETLHPDKLRPATEQVPERFELGTLPYELLAGVTAAIDVLADLVPGDEGTLSRRERIVRSMTALEEYEDDLHARMRSGLESIPGVRCYNHAPLRTPTELFSVDGVPSVEVYRGLAERGVNAPAGSFYAIEAAEWIGLGALGAVRAGLAPYTNADDVDRLLSGIAEIARP